MPKFQFFYKEVARENPQKVFVAERDVESARAAGIFVQDMLDHAATNNLVEHVGEFCDDGYSGFLTGKTPTGVRVYISSHDREAAQSLAAELGTWGHRVVSTWHHDSSASISTDDIWDNLSEIKGCDVLINIAGPDKYSGAKFFEAGAACALGKPLINIGCVENRAMSVAHVCQDHDELKHTLSTGLMKCC